MKTALKRPLLIALRDATVIAVAAIGLYLLLIVFNVLGIPTPAIEPLPVFYKPIFYISSLAFAAYKQTRNGWHHLALMVPMLWGLLTITALYLSYFFTWYMGMELIPLVACALIGGGIATAAQSIDKAQPP